MSLNFLQTGGGSGGSTTTVPSVILYVDGNRVDAYTADGTILKPFKTIAAAVSQVVTNADNSATKPYLIDIAPGTYAETIDLSNATIVNLWFEGHGRSGTVSAEGSVVAVAGARISPVAGNAVTSTSNNNAQSLIQFSGMVFTKPVNFTNPTTGGNLGLDGIFFSDCNFPTGSGPHVFNNIQVVSLVLSAIGNSITTTVTNCPNFTYVQSDYNGGTFNLVTNTGIAKPAGFVNSQVGIESWAFNPATLTIDAGSIMFAEGVGNFSGTITALHGSLELDQCVAYGNITVASDGVLTFAGVTNFGTITNVAGGTFTQTGSLYVGAVKIPGAANLVLATPNAVAGLTSLRALVGADLPDPAAATKGGVFSKAAVSHQFLTQIGTDATVSQAQPAFTDISGILVATQIPFGTLITTSQGMNLM